jgi:hypothetical protein
MNCLLEAALEAGVPFTAITLKGAGEGAPLWTGEGASLVSDHGFPDFTDESKALLTGRSEPVLSFIGGIKHVRLGLFRQMDDDRSEPPFDFVLPEAPHLPLESGTEVIPYDGVREMVRREFKRRMRLITRVSALAPGRVVQFGPPPPVSDRWLEPFLQKENVNATRLPNRLLRWKLWRVTVALFRQHAVECGAKFVDCPPEALDADGFMRDELVRNVTHGNVAFGRLLLAQAQSQS